jgi:quinol monooxygenase YgiN
MYGTVARFRLKPDAAPQMVALMKEYEHLERTGIRTSSLYQMDSDPNEYYLAVMFESREAYHANAQSPEQNDRYQKMAALIDGEPKWHDGEILYPTQD